MKFLKDLSQILKNIAPLLVLVLVGLVVVGGVDRCQRQNEVSELNKELMQADEEIGRAYTEFGRAQDYIDQLEEKQASDIKERNGLITRYAELEAKYERVQKDLKLAPTRIITEKVEIQVGRDDLTRGQYYMAISPSIIVKVDGFQGKYEDNRLWLTTSLDLTTNPETWKFNYGLNFGIELQFVESRLPSGAINHYAKMYEIDSKTGERVGEIPIGRFAVVVDYPEDKQMFWWAPHLDIGGMIGAGFSATPELLAGGSLGFSFSGYGQTKNDLEWRFFRLSLDFNNETAGVGITPVAYNVGQWLPLFSNIWVGPHVNWMAPEQWGVGVFIGAQL